MCIRDRLSNQVNERLRQAIEGDTVLAGIYKDLRNGAVVHSSEEETGDSTVILEEEGAGGQSPEGGQPSQEPAADPGQNSQEPAADPDQNSQGEGIQNVPAGQEGTETQGSQGTEPGTSGGSSVKIE